MLGQEYSGLCKKCSAAIDNHHTQLAGTLPLLCEGYMCVGSNVHTC